MSAPSKKSHIERPAAHHNGRGDDAEIRVRRMDDRLRAVAAAASGVINADSPEALRQILEAALRQVITFDAFFVQRYDREAHTFQGFGGLDAGVGSPKNVVSAAGTPNERVVRDRASLLVLSSDDPAGRGGHLTGTGRRSESVIRTPILTGGDVLGVLSIHSYQRDQYAEEDVQVVEIIAALAATAFENMRLADERRAAEEALIDRERQLAEAQRVAQLGSWRWTIGSDAVQWSDEMFRAYGMTPTPTGEVAFPDFVERLHPDDRGPLLHQVEQARETGRPYETVHRIVRSDGTVRTVLAHGEVTLDAAGRPAAMFGTGQDVTEAREAEAALQRAYDQLEERVRERTAELAERTSELERAEQRFRAIVEASPTPLLLSSIEDGTVLYANDRLEALIGVEPGSLQGMKTPDFYFKPGDRPGVIESVRRDGFVRDRELRIKRADGTPRWVSLSIRLLEFDGIPAAATALIDMTERKETEEALRRSEESYRGLFDNLEELVYVQDVEGRFKTVNDAVLRAYGYDRDEIVGSDPGMLAAPGLTDVEATMQAFRKAVEGRPQQLEFWGRRKDGSTFPKEVVLKRTRYFGEDVVIAVARDITERKRDESTLRLQKTLLEAQGEASIDGILVVNEGGGIVSFNQRFVDMWKIPADVITSRSDEAAIGAVLEQLVHPDEFIERVTYLYDHPDERARDEIELKDGRVLDRYSAPVISTEGDHYGRIWFFRDMTDQKRHEEELEAARREAELARVRASRYAKSLERELEFGRQIQQGLLPASLPAPPGWEVAVRFRPVWQVAGDFYDTFELHCGYVGFIIADVSGKGVGAALFMALFQSLLRASAERAGAVEACGPDGAEAILHESVRSTNDYITRVHRHAHMFASVFFGLLDPETGALHYVNAGHERPVVARVDGAVHRLDTTGPALGILADAPFDVRRVHLDVGDVLVAFTDGVTEARSDTADFFTEERLLSLFADPAVSASSILDRIETAVGEFALGAAPSDDLTLLALRRSTPHPSARS